MTTDCFLTNLSPTLKRAISSSFFKTAVDVLSVFPTRFEDWQNSCAADAFTNGEQVLIEGTITDKKTIPLRQGRQLLVDLLTSDEAVVKLRFFRVTTPLDRSLYAGRQLQARGVINWRKNSWEMAHPRLQSVNRAKQIISIYPASKKLNSELFQQLVVHAFETTNWQETPLPDSLLTLPRYSRKEAFQLAHLPHNKTDETALPNNNLALQWLCFEEILAHQIVLRQRYFSKSHCAPQLKYSAAWFDPWHDALPFKLTASQKTVINEITRDIQSKRPMRRLLQGDVGSGKTVVAAYACLLAAKNDYRAAVMAPTEILAKQHFEVFSALLKPVNIHCELITGAIKGKLREAAIKRFQFGISQVVIGTHTLFQDTIEMPKLALTVIDEQHRFGVMQRQSLTDKGVDVHQLMMSATPIPRTLAMSIFADRDVSTLTEKPQGRKPIQTVLIDDKRRHQVLERVYEHIKNGGRVYWVCPLIDESDATDLMTTTTLNNIIEADFPTLRHRILHGRMKDTEKRKTMADFQKGEFDILIATTVIEVGVDVPTADVMIIEHADRLGLSQLHQLRGRVGRGDKISSCILLYQTPLTPVAQKRLKILQTCDDGFKIAHYDLAMRGPGQWLGNKQSGLPALRIAALPRDRKLATQAIKVADWLLKNDQSACVQHLRFWLPDQLKSPKLPPQNSNE